jgi:hypothetical protein
VRWILGSRRELDDDPAPIARDRGRRYLGEESSAAYDLERTFGS